MDTPFGRGRRTTTLVVIGATRDPLFRQRVLGSLPEEFARKCETPLVMVKATHPVRSFIRRWI